MKTEALGGVITCTGKGSSASLIIPIGDYRVMVLSDDNLGGGEGEILRSELFVYRKGERPSQNINTELFGSEFVIATNESLLKAIDYVRGLEK